MSLTEARRLAVDNVMEIRARFPRKSGIDRLLESADSAAPLALTGPTFRELASDYIEFKRRDGWKHGSKTKKITRSHLSNYAYPVIGKIQIEQVTHVHVSEVLAPIWNTKPPTAKKVKQTLSLVFKFAFGQGYAVEDHTERAVMGLGRQRHKTKHHPAVHYSQVGEVLEYVRGAGTYPTKRLALGS